jgi:4-carboxymuconolactone decarboxylase
VREEAIEAASAKAPTAGLTDEERTVIDYVREIVRGHQVSDATFASAHALLGDRGIVDLTATAGYYGMLACALNAFEVHPREGGPTFPGAT